MEEEVEEEKIETENKIERAATSPKRSGCKSFVLSKKFVFLVIFLSLLVIVMSLFYIFKDECLDIAFAYFDWIQDNPWQGILIYTAIFIFWVTVALPGSLLTLAGAIIFTQAFGFWLGFIIILIIAVSSHVIAGFFSFIIGKYLIYDCIRPAFAKFKKLRAFDEALKVKGFKVMFLLRINPIMSYAALNYGSSTTDVKLRQFIFGYVGTIPNEAAYIYMATVVGNIAEAANGTDSFGAVGWVFLGVGLALVIVLTIYIIRLAGKELKKLEEHQREDNGEEVGDPEGGNPDAELGRTDAAHVEENKDNIYNEENIEESNLSGPNVGNITSIIVKNDGTENITESDVDTRNYLSNLNTCHDKEMNNDVEGESPLAHVNSTQNINNNKLFDTQPVRYRVLKPLS